MLAELREIWSNAAHRRGNPKLQRACGDGPIYPSARTAANLIGVNHVKASRRLRGLRRDGILRLVSEGSQKDRRASRYRYVAE